VTSGDSRTLKATPLAKQGDLKAYTKAARKNRLKLREHPRVLEQLERWWALVVKDATHRTDEAGGLLITSHTTDVEPPPLLPPYLRLCMRTSTRPTLNLLLLLPLPVCASVSAFSLKLSIAGTSDIGSSACSQ
jgi:hypothetical protein